MESHRETYAAADPPTPAAAAATENLVAYIQQLEAILGRSWGEEDQIRALNRVLEVYDTGIPLIYQVHQEIAHLGGDYRRLPDLLSRYYRLLLRAMPVVMESRSAPSRESDLDLDLDLDFNLDSYLGDYSDSESDDDGEICSICLEDLERGFIAILECRHEFHDHCIWRWLSRGRNACPLCRRPVRT